MNSFNFCYVIDTDLSVNEIWPDGDAPENPTVDDVMEVIRRCGGAAKVICDWNLIESADFDLRKNRL